MSNRISKAELKKPDAFTATGQKILNWLAENAMIVVAVLGAGVVVLLGIGAWSYVSENREIALQEKYFVLEKKLQETRARFEEAAAAERMKKADPKAAANANKGPMATGDLEKDYGNIPLELEAFINEAPQSNAALMAGLHLANLYSTHGKVDQALGVLQKLNTGEKTNSFLRALIVHQKAALTAEKGDCAGAISLWEKISSDKKAQFLHQESKLNIGLCHEKNGDLTAAQKFYGEAAQGADADSAAAKDAEKYLRLSRLKQSQGS